MKIKKTIKGLFIGMAVIFGLSVLACATGGMVDEDKNVDSVPMNSDKKEEKKIEYIKVSAEDLINEYEENELKADKKYKDKHLEITGIIYNISKVLNQTTVDLGNGEDLQVTTVNCKFAKKYEDDVAELEKGSTIIVTGICEGKGWSVDIKGCEIK
jgi:hypothetical protein